MRYGGIAWLGCGRVRYGVSAMHGVVGMYRCVRECGVDVSGRVFVGTRFVGW